MGEMASNLAHELNQPISAIANYLQGSQSLLASGEHPDLRELSEGLARANDQAFRAGEIMHRLRNFVARGAAESRVENVPALITEASALALIGTHNQDLRVRFELDQRVQVALVDRIQIQQVLHNLIRNAVEAMAEARSPSRKLTISTRLADDTRAEISVADSGPGISASVGDRLFRPFVTTKKDGLGVGLSISRAIVEGHGGNIWVEPNIDGGAVFKFTLPSLGRGEVADAR
jgi:two-component system sensor kinase FixL